MKKIKILRIVTRLNIGGPAIHAILLTKDLDKDKFDSLLIYGRTGCDEGAMDFSAEKSNLPTVFIKELRRELNPINDLIALIKIYLVIGKEQPDIIHCHTTKAGALGRLAGIIYNLLHFFNRRKVVLIYTSHGSIFEGYFNRLATKFFIYAERFLSWFTSRLIMIGEPLKTEALRLRIAKENQIEVIRLGFDLKKFLLIQTPESVKFQIGIVGRLTPIKNVRLFLEAANKTIKNNPHLNLKFKIIGDGELLSSLEKFCQSLDIQTYVDFLGWQNDLVSVYSDLDIVALTSNNEGTPVSIIEAMASARPIVATAVGGVPDLLGKERKEAQPTNKNFHVAERGLLVRPNDAIAFSDALSFLLQNKTLRKQMGSEGRRFTATNFTKARLVRDIEDLYRRLISPCDPTS